MIKISNSIRCSLLKNVMALIDQNKLEKCQYLLIKVLYNNEDIKQSFDLFKS